jgi:hypothetical protein
MTETENKTALTTSSTEADNIIAAAREGGGFDKLLKFRKGEFLVGDETVALGTEYLAHAAAWTKTWLKFVDGKLAERKVYRVARGERPPERDELDDNDESCWPEGRDGKPSDPWVFQYLLPLEDMATGELLIFVTPSVGGQQAVRELCDHYAKRVKKGQHGQPIIKLATTTMPTKNYGKVSRPLFEIIDWDDAEVPLAAAAEAEKVAANADMNDEIPF